MPDHADLKQRIEESLGKVPDPETGRAIGQLGQFKSVVVEPSKVRVEIGLTTHSAPLWEDARLTIEDEVKRVVNDQFTIETSIIAHDRPPEPIGNIGLKAKSVVAVGSGKGGVGKSTVAASLALSLDAAGCRVGLMDADVYGPSIPHLIGATGQPTAVDNRLQPVDVGRLKVMSMGFLVPPGEAVVWRGPMLHGAITQFLRDTDWGDLDYLVIDMPPGTGDIALTLSQLLPLTGAVVVCTPQDVALLDAVKAIAMFRKVNIPILGVVENMSYFLCPDNGKRYDLFGSGGARKKAEELQVPFLGEIPIQMPIRERGDAGTTVENVSDTEASPFFQRIAYNLAKNIATSRAAEPALPSLSVL